MDGNMWAKSLLIKLLALSCSLVASSNSFANTSPDGGSLVQETQTLPELEQQPDENLSLTTEEPETEEVKEGQLKVLVTKVDFGGNSIFSDTHLQEIVSEYIDTEMSYAELVNLAAQVQGEYQEAGYFLTQVYLPEQSLEDGLLEINIVEGRLGKAVIDTQGELKESVAERYIKPLQEKIIKSDELERKIRLLSDLAGNDVHLTLQPSEKDGYADLTMTTIDTGEYSGYLGVDNLGNRFVGQSRLSGQLNINNNLGYGELISLNTALSAEGYRYLALGAALPLGGDGLTLNSQVAASQYKLGENFEPLQASGDSRVYSLGLSYPIKRSLNSNLYVSANAMHQKFDDKVDATNSESDKRVSSIEISLKGDELTPGVSAINWNAAITLGKVNVDAVTESNDIYNTVGEFSKINANLSYQKGLSTQWGVGVTLEAQYTADNLDSSSKMQLGGVNGVRAYPQGEGLVDYGVIGRFELNNRMTDGFTMAGFVDYATGKQYKKPQATDLDNTREYAGAGLKADWQIAKQLSLHSTLAWRLTGLPQSDSKDLKPRILLQLVKQF